MDTEIGGAIIGGAIGGFFSSIFAPPPAAVVIVPAPPPVIIDTGPTPWSPDWMDYCNAKYRSFNPRSGYFTGYDGVEHFCR